MTITSSIIINNDYCQACWSFFKRFESCPRSYIFAQGEVIGSTLEFIWVFSSMIPFFIFFAMVGHSIYKRTARGFFMVANIFIQQVACALLKLYFAQARPLGACSVSYGLPSGHSGFASALTLW